MGCLSWCFFGNGLIVLLFSQVVIFVFGVVLVALTQNNLLFVKL